MAAGARRERIVALLLGAILAAIVPAVALDPYVAATATGGMSADHEASGIAPLTAQWPRGLRDAFEHLAREQLVVGLFGDVAQGQDPYEPLVPVEHHQTAD